MTVIPRLYINTVDDSYHLENTIFISNYEETKKKENSNSVNKVLFLGIKKKYLIFLVFSILLIYKDFCNRCIGRFLEILR